MGPIQNTGGEPLIKQCAESLTPRCAAAIDYSVRPGVGTDPRELRVIVQLGRKYKLGVCNLLHKSDACLVNDPVGILSQGLELESV
jgi:hypothetical protein